MKKYQNIYFIVAAIIVVLAVASGLTYLKSKKDVQSVQVENNSVSVPETENEEIATSSSVISKEVTKVSSVLKCEEAINKEISTLKSDPSMSWLSIRLVESGGFDSLQKTKDFLKVKGFEDEYGHNAQDILLASTSKNFVITFLALKTDFIETDKNGAIVFPEKVIYMEALQPIACVDDKIGEKSKYFLTVSLRDFISIHRAISQYGSVVE